MGGVTNRLEKGTFMNERVLKIPGFLTSSGSSSASAASLKAKFVILLKAIFVFFCRCIRSLYRKLQRLYKNSRYPEFRYSSSEVGRSDLSRVADLCQAAAERRWNNFNCSIASYLIAKARIWP